MKKKVQVLLLLCMLALSLGGMAVAGHAAEDDTTMTAVRAEKTGWSREGKWYFYYGKNGKKVTGWQKINGKLYYFRKQADGEAPVGSRATGFSTVGKKTFYFSNKGILQTGWKKISGKNYYFEPKGKAGAIGEMYTGFRKIKSGRKNGYFLFQEDGAVTVGWAKYKGKTYFFSNSAKLGIRGRAITGWKTLGKNRYFFSTYGVMQKNRWISKKYYLGSDGKLLKGCVTPDGYVVNASGVKVRVAKGWIKSNGEYYYYISGKKATGWKTIGGKKYYFDENGVRQHGLVTVGANKYYLKSGVMQTGLQTIDGKFYYFLSDGKMAVGTTIDGYTIDADGVATKNTSETEDNSKTEDDPSGKGNGAKILILSGHGQGDAGATATIGKTTYYEYKYTREFAKLIYNALSGANLHVTLYDQNYDLYQVMSGKKSGPIPNLKDYDYVLEIHFNATAVSGKDLKGDGNFKGVGMYINSAKKNYTIDKNIVAAIAKTGFKVWGGGAGIFRSSGLFNAKTCQSKGVSYGLLETAFIDDKDDMEYYNKNKEAMAKAVANALVSYFK